LLGSYRRRISPNTLIARGIHTLSPKALVNRSAKLVFPLPGAPYRNSPRPELIAWPTWLRTCSLTTRSAKARRRSASRGFCRVTDCASTLAV